MKSIDDCVKEAVMMSMPARQTEEIMILKRIEKKLDDILKLLKEAEQT